MSCGGRKTVDNSKAGGEKIKKAESQRVIEKEVITSTEFPEGGNTTSTKAPPGIPTGVAEQVSTLSYTHGKESQTSCMHHTFSKVQQASPT